jgi:hypothetical protein
MKNSNNFHDLHVKTLKHVPENKLSEDRPLKVTRHARIVSCSNLIPNSSSLSPFAISQSSPNMIQRDDESVSSK